jgi:mannose-6-phosphate isomerase-like protein (cupin superfamily)
MKRFFTIAELESEHHGADGKRYMEFVRVPALSAGIYVLPKDGIDRQSPHGQDEIYYVVRGQGRMSVLAVDAAAGAVPEDHPVAAGTVIFVEAGAKHYFHSVTEELAVLVAFGPAEG